MGRKRRASTTLHMIQVPMPFIQHYNEQGEIVDNEPLPTFDTPFLRLLPRLPDPDVAIYDWKPSSGRGDT